MKKYEKAYEIFSNAINIRRKIGDNYGVANSINNLAFTLLQMGDEQGARDGFTESLNLSRNFQDYSGVAVTLNNFGYTEIDSNQPIKAIAYATDAFKVAETIGNEYQMARAYDVKGKAYLQLHEMDNATSNLKKALQLFNKLKVPEAIEAKTVLEKLC